MRGKWPREIMVFQVFRLEDYIIEKIKKALTPYDPDNKLGYFHRKTDEHGMITDRYFSVDTGSGSYMCDLDDLYYYSPARKELVYIEEELEVLDTINKATDLLLRVVEHGEWLEEVISNIGISDLAFDMMPELRKRYDFVFLVNNQDTRIHISPMYISEKIYTVWEFWSSYDAYNGEYDSGEDFVGIFDLYSIFQKDNRNG